MKSASVRGSVIKSTFIRALDVVGAWIPGSRPKQNTTTLSLCYLRTPTLRSSTSSVARLNSHRSAMTLATLSVSSICRMITDFFPAM
jgi:hypothetical protein